MYNAPQIIATLDARTVLTDAIGTACSAVGCE
jgi:hypothetical protein